MVTVEQEKMSKSLGNFLTIEAALSKVSTPEVLRQVLLSSHYRMALDFSTQKLAEAEKGLARIYETLARTDEAIGDTGIGEVSDDSFFVNRFREAMDDDCNTPRALGVIFDGVREMNRKLDAGQIDEAAILRSEIAKTGGVLGLLQEPPAQFLERQKQTGLAEASLTPEVIEALIDERAVARKEKNFQRADEIRAQLAEQGVLLKDSPTGTTWTVK